MYVLPILDESMKYIVHLICLNCLFSCMNILHFMYQQFGKVNTIRFTDSVEMGKCGYLNKVCTTQSPEFMLCSAYLYHKNVSTITGKTCLALFFSAFSASDNNELHFTTISCERHIHNSLCEKLNCGAPVGHPQLHQWQPGGHLPEEPGVLRGPALYPVHPHGHQRRRPAHGHHHPVCFELHILHH